jgi:hypothetical protein
MHEYVNICEGLDMHVLYVYQMCIVLKLKSYFNKETHTL